MDRSLRAVILALVLTGCGGSGSHPPAGFVNQTRHSMTDLWAIWKSAQDSVARRIDLNPLQRSLYHVPAQIVPGDSRSRTTLPRQILVAAELDVSSSDLLAATGVARSDPTGLIACPLPCNVRFAAAYSRFQHPRVEYAASWEFKGENFALILQYEFESQILFALGYDVKWR